jgi:hypothetical protein
MHRHVEDAEAGVHEAWHERVETKSRNRAQYRDTHQLMSLEN